jgi:hypothetical protein
MAVGQRHFHANKSVDECHRQLTTRKLLFADDCVLLVTTEKNLRKASNEHNNIIVSPLQLWNQKLHGISF